MEGQSENNYHGNLCTKDYMIWIGGVQVSSMYIVSCRRYPEKKHGTY